MRGMLLRQEHEISNVVGKDAAVLSRRTKELGFVGGIFRDPVVRCARDIVATIQERLIEMPAGGVCIEVQAWLRHPPGPSALPPQCRRQSLRGGLRKTPVLRSPGVRSTPTLRRSGR